MRKRYLVLLLVLFICILVSTLCISGFYFFKDKNIVNPFPSPTPTPIDPTIVTGGDLKNISSEVEFLEIIENSTSGDDFFGGIDGGLGGRGAPQLESAIPDSNTIVPPSEKDYSTTNVQVRGIDEPDIVKTNGTNIFVAQDPYYADPIPFSGEEPISMELSNGDEPYKLPPPPNTSVVDAYPVENLGLLGDIEMSGDMLLYDNYLVILSVAKVNVYDVKNPSDPQKLWDLEYDSSTGYIDARLFENDLYLVLRHYIDYQGPCPLPLTMDKGITLECTDIYYYPNQNSYLSSTLTLLKLDLKDGKVEDKFSLLTSDETINYMSADNFYIASTSYLDYTELYLNVLVEIVDEKIDQDLATRITEIRDLPISDTSKFYEMTILLEKYESTLSPEEQANLSNEFETRFEKYLEENIRDFSSTEITRLDLNNFSNRDTGNVPGTPLNQFALDEYNGFLRIAITNQGDFSSENSVSDLYILDKDLDQISSVKDLGKAEDIYAVRFLGDTSYVVTFRQIDPFYVLDLKDPHNPKLAGELKIPGYSSYLHPLSDERILGIGEENGNVKLSIFDVSDPINPKEINKYQLNEYWSDVESDHHAFLYDQRNEYVFLPAGSNGYVFDVENNITMQKQINGINANRALYIEDNLYVVGSNSLIVYSIGDFEEIGSLNL